MRRQWLHKHALFCKCMVSQDWMQWKLWMEHSKFLTTAREIFSDFLSLYKFSLHLLCNIESKFSFPRNEKELFPLKGGTISTFCVIDTAKVSHSQLHISFRYVCVCIKSYACTYIHVHVHIYSHTSTYSAVAWQGKVNSFAVIINRRTCYG